MFYTRSAATLQATFTNPNAAYIVGAPGAIPSPLNIGLENSRRFRALPAYAVLHSEGRPGLRRAFAAMAQLARRVAAWIRDSDDYELLPGGAAGVESVFVVVMFRAKDTALNERLVEKVNETRVLYVSGTRWKGEPATRIAVSTWRVDVERDFALIKSVLSDVAEAA
jgi:glutamate/tyrosine decarboxylase-like PLP-dependent enzyme